MNTASLALILAASFIGADADEPEPEAPTKPAKVAMPAEKAYAMMRIGLPYNKRHDKVDSRHNKGHHHDTPHGRVYTVKELIDKYGEPFSRIGEGWEWWIWVRKDGTVKAQFISRGYVRADDPKSLRLEINDVLFNREEK